MQVHIVQVIVVCKLVTGNTQYDLGFFFKFCVQFSELKLQYCINYALFACLYSQ